MADKGNNLDDLIGSSSQPIIVQESGGDKKFLYTLIIILVVLFIIALGVIAFISGKYFGNKDSNNEQNIVAAKVSKPINSTNIQKAAATPASKTIKEEIEVAKNSNSNSVSELEKLVQEQEQATKVEPKIAKPKPVEKKQKEQSAIAKAASAATGGKALSSEELAKIAQLVAQELAKSKTQTTNTSSTQSSKDDALIASLQSAQTDTLKTQNVDTSNVKDSKVNTSSKKVDTFNKVVVKEQAGGDDEIAKLSSEIDSILQSSEVTDKEKSLKYGKELKQEISSREREMRFIVVRQGDTLSSLAYKAYGRASAYKKIYQANPDLVKNPNRIYIGMKLRVPVDQEYIKQQGN
jgi:nucleoid-associated protein YgaU